MMADTKNKKEKTHIQLYNVNRQIRLQYNIGNIFQYFKAGEIFHTNDKLFKL